MQKSKTMNKVEGGHRNSHLSPRNASPSMLSDNTGDGLSIRNPAISQHIRRKTAPRALNNNNRDQTGTNDENESTMTMSVHELASDKGGRKQQLAKKKVNFRGAAPDEMEFRTKKADVSQDDDDNDAASSVDSDSDPRQALYLDDKRYVVLFVVFLAGIVNFLGFNVIQVSRINVSDNFILKIAFVGSRGAK